MGFLQIDYTVEAAEQLLKIAASSAAVAGAVSAKSIGTVVGGTGVVVGASVLMHTVLSPVRTIINTHTPTPSPSPFPTRIPKVQCPDAGAAMFAGYKVSNTSEDIQLFMVTLTDLPERLELFLTNSFSLPTMSEEFARNKTGSVKMIIPSGGFSAGTLFGYESPALAISEEFMWQNSASGLILPEHGSDVLLYCRDDWRMLKIASLSYGMTQEDVPDDLRNFSIAIPDSSCAFYKGANIGTAEELIGFLARNESFDTTSCSEPGFGRDTFNLSLKVIEPNSKPSMQPSVPRSPSQTPTDLRSEEPSLKPTLSMDPTSPPSHHPSVSSEPSVSHLPTEKPSVKTTEVSTEPSVSTTTPLSLNPTKVPPVSMRPSSTASALPTESAFPRQKPRDGPTESTKPSSNPSLHPSKSLGIVSKPSMGPSVSISLTTKISGKPLASIGPSLSGSLLPTVSDSPSENSSDPPTQRIEPSIKPSSTASISIDHSSASSIGPSESQKASRTRAPVSLNEKDQIILTSQHPTYTSIGPSLKGSLLPTVSPSTASISVDPSSASSIGLSESHKASRTRAPISLNEKDHILTSQHPSHTSIGPPLKENLLPTVSPSTASISVDPSSASIIGPSESHKASRTRAPISLNEKDHILTSQHPSHTSIGPSLKENLLPTVSPSTASISVDPSSASSIGPSESHKASRTQAPISLNEKDQILTSQHPTHTSIRPSLKENLLPTVSPYTASISVDPSSASSIGPSENHKASRTRAP
eukprot:scaffold33464_cov56-Attheya_sp.AAC.1